MNELIERLKKATGHDRDLNCDILVAVTPGCRKKQAPGFESLISYVVNRDGELDVPRYTDSIDAAVTLIPAGYRWKAGYSKHVPHVAELVDYGQHAIGSFAGECDSNRAIAICIAALQARAAV